MPELQLIGGAASNFVWACRIALAEKGVPYTHISVMPHTPEVDAIHPLGKIPAMRHGDVALGESRAICGYIDRAFEGPALIPADLVQAAKVEQWLSVVNTAIDPIWVRQYVGAHLFPGTADGTPDRTRIVPALVKMEQQMPVMDRAVAATGHLVGESFTLADMNFVPILFYMNKFSESAALLAKSPNLTAYLQRHMGRKSVRESIPQEAPGTAGRASATRAA